MFRFGTPRTNLKKKNKQTKQQKFMKKILSISMIALMVISLASCNWFNKKKSNNNKEIAIEALVSEDAKYMTENYDTSFVYYETEIILNDFLDNECDGTYEIVTNVFQTFTLVDDTIQQPNVFKFIHIGGTTSIEKITGYWLEDVALRDGDILLTFNDAFQKIIETNCPKPHARTCTLRKEVGPCPSNAQYIFGNIYSQLYVDAITGDVLENSPAFDCNKTEAEEVVPQQ